MKCLVTSFGSAGDFLPTLSVGVALRNAGHDVLFVSNPFYEPLARAVGLGFEPAGPYLELFAQLEKNPLYIDSIQGPEAIWNDFAVPHITDTYRVIRDRLASEPFDVVISSNVSAGGIWAAHDHNLPYVIVAATPLSWMNGNAPMVVTDHAPPSFMLPLLNQSLRKTITWYLDRKLRGLARSLGVRMRDPGMTGAENAARLHVGLWSPSFRASAEGDPPNTIVCGFARAGHLGQRVREPDPRLEEFLGSSPSPVVVGLGSVVSLNAGSLLLDLAIACETLGRRCLVVGHPSNPPAFPSNALAVKYAPYDRVFSHGGVVVVHGGAGTTAEALRAGRPVLALPFAYDQFAMAWQVEKLGVGMKLSKGNRKQKHLVSALSRLLSGQAIQERAASLGASLRLERDGAEAAAEKIERMVVSQGKDRAKN